MKKYYLMKCGHVAGAYDPYGNPVCVVCAGMNDGSDIVEMECVGNVGLEGRTAKCTECLSKTASAWDLPFFKYCPEKEFDEYYDGCYGWN